MSRPGWWSYSSQGWSVPTGLDSAAASASQSPHAADQAGTAGVTARA